MFSVWYCESGMRPNRQPPVRVAICESLDEAQGRFRQPVAGAKGEYFLLAGTEFAPDDPAAYLDSFDVR